MTIGINVEVVYALATHQTIARVQLEDGATVRDAIVRSGVLRAHPDLALERCEVAIWGRIVSQDSIVRDRDRVEICRRLTVDAKSARKRRAAEKR